MANLSGERLGPFEVRSLIGTGGFATVYRAHDPRLGTDVALKILAENHSLDPAIRERFLGEANALRRIESSAVIRIYDIRETADARPYLVLEHADRGNLVERRRAHSANGWRPSPADVQYVVATLAEALDAVHAEDLVHRDITPANILIRSGRRATSRPGVALVEPDERLLLSDMGLVKDLAAGSGLTVGGGTAGYWAPEQQQVLASIDHRADIFSATAVVVWLLVGLAVTTSPEWQNEVRAAGWSESVIAELDRGLAHEPNDRHQSARDWEAALLRAISMSPSEGPAHHADFAERQQVASAANGPSAPPQFIPVDRPALAPPAPGQIPQEHTPVAPPAPSGRSLASTFWILRIAAVALALLLGVIVLVLVLDDNADFINSRGAQPASEDLVSQDSDQQDSGDDSDQQDNDQQDSGDDSDQQDNVQQDSDDSGNETTSGGESMALRSIDTWAFAAHGGGSQLVVQQISVMSDRTVVAVDLVNGRNFDTTFAATEANTRLVDEDGTRYELMERARITLEPGEATSTDLVFAPLPLDTTRLRLDFAVTEDDVQTVDEIRPGFSVEVEISDDKTAPPLLSPIAIDDVTVHSNQVTIRVIDLAFSPANVSVSFEATNVRRSRVFLSSGHHASYLKDDLGNQHWLQFEGDGRMIPIASGEAVLGILVFSGRLHPDATTLRLVLNHETIATDATSSTPLLEVGPWNLDGSFVGATLPRPIRVDRTATHANGVAMTIGAIIPAATSTGVEILASNEAGNAKYLNGCCDHTYLVDSLGNRYAAVPPADNDRLIVAGGERLDMTLRFAGALDNAATTIELVVNDRDEAGQDGPDTAHPLFTFGPFPLERDGQTRSATLDTTASVTRWESANLDS